MYLIIKENVNLFKNHKKKNNRNNKLKTISNKKIISKYILIDKNNYVKRMIEDKLKKQNETTFFFAIDLVYKNACILCLSSCSFIFPFFFLVFE